MHFILGILLIQAAQEGPEADKPAEDAELLETVVERIRIGGQVRLRAEYRDPLSYVDTAAAREDDDIFLSRIRLNLTFSVTDQIDVFVQPQDQRVFGDEGSIASDENNLDLHQGYVEIRNIGDTGLSFKGGRQELNYGDQRIISPLDWSNVGRAWDGFKVRYSVEESWVDGFYTVLREGGDAEDDRDFFGFYASCRAVEDHEFDVYLLGRQLFDDMITDEQGNTGDVRDLTVGARVNGASGPIDYSGEAMYQFGDYVEDDLSAWAAAFTAGYTGDCWGKPRIGIEYTAASGDKDPTDGKRETYDPLFPFGHFYQGFADVFAFKNGHDLAGHFRISPAESVTVQVDVHGFWLDERRDAWYGANGAAIRRDVTGAARDEVGTEIDFHVRVSAGKHVKFWGGWSHFFAGDYLEDTPGSRADLNWFFLQMVVSF